MYAARHRGPWDWRGDAQSVATATTTLSTRVAVGIVTVIALVPALTTEKDPPQVAPVTEQSGGFRSGAVLDPSQVEWGESAPEVDCSTVAPDTDLWFACTDGASPEETDLPSAIIESREDSW